MRGNTVDTSGPIASAYGTLNAHPNNEASLQPSRDGRTPIGGASSCVSGNYTAIANKQLYEQKKK